MNGLMMTQEVCKAIKDIVNDLLIAQEVSMQVLMLTEANMGTL